MDLDEVPAGHGGYTHVLRPAELGSHFESSHQNSTRPHVTILVHRMLYGAPRCEKCAEGL